MNKKKVGWIDMELNESYEIQTVGFLADPTDQRVIELIAKGSGGVHVPWKTRKERQHFGSILAESDALLATAALMLRHEAVGLKSSDIGVIFSLRGAWWIPSRRKVCIQAATDRRFGEPHNIPGEIKASIQKRLDEYRLACEQWKARKGETTAETESLAETQPETASYGLGPPAKLPSFPTFIDLLQLLPHAAWSVSDSRRHILDAIDESGMPLATEPPHHIRFLLNAKNKSSAVITWQAPSPQPSFYELIGALRRYLPSGFEKPLRQGATQPDFPSVSGAAIDVEIENGWPVSNLSEAYISENEYPSRAKRARELVSGSGFEALGWYQSFHIYDDGWWGIYLHGERLADLSCALAEDMRDALKKPFPPLITLALELVLHHEWFHFQVDAVTALTEIESKRPKYRQYFYGVYTNVFQTDDCLEEAFANWHSISQVGPRIGSMVRCTLSNPERSRALEVVEAWFDRSPAGYNKWRLGEERLPWRRFATQISAASKDGYVHGIPLPIQSNLQHPVHIDLRPHHCPVRIVQIGPFKNVTPFAVNRRAAIALLKRFGYQMIKGRGKGSHDFYRGPDGRGFPLPRRDPLSNTVFKNLREHFNLSVEQYTKEHRGAF